MVLVLLWPICVATNSAAVAAAESTMLLLTSHGEHVVDTETAALMRLQEEVAIPIKSSTELWNDINLG